MHDLRLRRCSGSCELPEPNEAERRAIPYGAGTEAATAELVTATARRVYADYPDILRALGLAG